MKIFIKLIKLFENGQENRNHKLESLKRKKWYVTIDPTGF